MIIAFLVPLFFLFLSLGEVGRISFFGQQVNAFVFEPVLFIILCYYAFRYRLKPIQDLWKNYKSIIAFFVFSLAIFIFGWYGYTPLENWISLLYLIRLTIYILFYIYMSYAAHKDKDQKKIVERGFVLFAGITLISSFIQYVFYPELRNLLYLGWDPHLYRMFGTFLDTSVAAAVYGLIAIFFYFLFRSKGIVTKYVLCLGSILCLLFTFSRTAYGVFFLLMLAVLVAEKKFKLLLITICLAVGVLLIIPKPFGEGVNLARTFSIESRLNDYSQAFILWQKKPLLGFGYNRLRYVKRQYGFIEPKNFDMTHAGASYPSFLEILVTEGVVGLLLFIWMLYSLVKRSKIGLIAGGFLALLSLADNILLHPIVLIVFLCFLSLTAVNYPSSSSQ